MRPGPPVANPGQSFRNFLGSLSIQASQRLSRLLILVIAGMWLETDGFAVLAIALALADLGRAALLSFDVAAIRELAAGNPSDAVIGPRVIGKCVLGVVIAVVTSAASLVIYGPPAAAAVFVLGIGLVPASLATLWLIPLQVELRLETVAVRVAIASGLAILFGGLGAATGSVLGVAVAVSLGDVLMFGIIFVTMRLRLRWTRESALSALRESPALMAMQLAYIGQFRVGTLVLGVTATAQAVGDFTVAARAAEGVVILSTALIASSFPMMADARSRNARIELTARFSDAYRVSLIVSSIVLAVLTMGAPLWLPIVFPKFPGALAPFAATSIAVILFFANGQTTTLLNAVRADRIAATSAGTGLLLTTILSIPLSIGAGALGAAIARVMGELWRLLIETAWIRRLRLVGPASVLQGWIVAGPVIAFLLLIASG